MRSGGVGILAAGIVMIGMPAAKAAFTDGHGNQIDVVEKTRDTSQETVWTISSPNITQQVTNYPAIQFLPGDKFRVLAGGCDQTGGHGKTWKRYVNPQGDNADRLYHGLIRIPYAQPGGRPDPTLAGTPNADFSRLSDYGVGDGMGHGEPSEHVIPDPLPDGRDPKKTPLFLQLGFEDDGYGDNGYWGRDPGDNDQCVNVPPSFVVITIGHHGAIPEDPRLYWGVRPADFDCQAGWAFENQGTPQLSYASFQTAFNISWAGKYLNPFNELLFLTQRGIASSGNCEGMCLLSLAGEDQFTVGDLNESFWANYRYGKFLQTPANIQFDINVAHWQQLSGYFVNQWLGSIESDASTVTSRIEHDLTGTDFNYGMLSLKHGGGGHVLVPLGVTHTGPHTFISVYDPNRPCSSIPNTANNPKIDVVGENWSYDMGGHDGVWSGQNGALGLFNNGMAYIPYHGPDDGWTDQVTSLSGLATAVFGSDTTVEQVTDGRGRQLYVGGQPDRSENGLGRSVVKLLKYDADTEQQPKRPRSGDKAKVLRVDRVPEGTPEQRALLERFDREYAEYDQSEEVYVVRDPKLTELTFTLSSKAPGKPVRAVINQGGTFIEARSQPASGSDRIRSTFIIHSLADAAHGGVVMRAAAGAPTMKVTFTHGLYDDRARTEVIQRSAEIATAAAGARIGGNAMALQTAEPPQAASVILETITPDARAIPPLKRTLTTEKLP